MVPVISVVVCSYNGARRLPVILSSLSAQTMPSHSYEVIVVDDGSTDDTASVAADALVRVVHLEPNAGLAAARNAGVTAARAGIVAFIDDDCEATPEWLRSLLHEFDDDEVEGVSGPVLPECGRLFLHRFLCANNPLKPIGDELLFSDRQAYRLWLYWRNQWRGSDAPLPVGLYSVVGANMAFRRSVLFDVGGFDEAFRFGSEEEDLCRRLHARRCGAKLRCAHDAIVVHRFDERISSTLSRARAYGRGNARNALKNPHVRLIVFPTPVLTLACLLAAVACDRRWLVGATAAPLIGYPGWLREAWLHNSLEPMCYPVLQLAQELYTMVGELEGYRAGYRPVPSRHLRES